MNFILDYFLASLIVVGIALMALVIITAVKDLKDYFNNKKDK